MDEKPRRGRPRRVVPVTELDLLTIPQTVLYLRIKGRPISRAKLRQQIVLGAFTEVYLDELHLDSQGRPTYKIPRKAVDLWILASLRRITPTRFATSA